MSSAGTAVSRKNAKDLVENAEVVGLVQDLVRIPSVAPKEKAISEYLVNYFERMGIPVKTQELFPERVNIVARLKGTGASEPLMFSSHMDVVPVSEAEVPLWHCDPFSGEIKEGFIWGRGSADMKGGLAASMVAMAILARNKIQPNGDIVLAVTVDEEVLKRGAEGLLQSGLIDDVGHAVICEPTKMVMHTSCRGRTWGEITVLGKTGHTSMKGIGTNAIDRMNRLLSLMASHEIPHTPHPILGGPHWQPTMISGGNTPGVVPDWCKVTVDARMVPGQTSVQMWEEIEKLFEMVQQETGDFKAEIKVAEKREPWQTPSEDKLVRVLGNACESIGLSPETSGFVATTDGSIFRTGNIVGVIFGPGDLGRCHLANEALPIDELIQATKIYAEMMCKW
jgi:acetylornithine deacetylase/succinyl-diaminopimelate desuccinylase family protein